jgi:hypothetical protein
MQPNTGIPRIGAINRSHPLARGLVYAGVPIPGQESGGVLHDLAGNTRGTILGPTWASATSQALSNRSLNFTSEAYVDAGNHAAVDITGTGFSVSAWIKPTATLSSFYRMVEKAAVYPALQYSFVLAQGFGVPRLDLYLDGMIGSGTTATTPVVAGVWQMVSATYDGATVRFYRNGQPDGSGARSGNITATTSQLLIGKYAHASSYGFEGSISDVLLWNRAISATEVQSLYQKPLGMFNRTRVPVGRVAAATSSKLLLRLASEGLFVGSHY